MKIKKLQCMVASLAMLMGLGLAACGGDGDDNGGSGRIPGGKNGSGVFTTEDGNVRVAQVGNYKYFYDDQGRISSITEWSYEEISFSYSPNKIITGEDGDEEASISYTGAGYVSKASEDITFTEDGEKHSLKGSVSMSYDGSGHLTGLTGSATEKGYEGGKPFTWNTSIKYTLQWSGGLLRSINRVTKEKDTGGEDDGYYYNENDTQVFDYDSSDPDSYLNTYQQWAPSLTELLDDTYECISYIGLLGKGPQYLPSSSTYTYEDDENGTEHSRTYNYTYRYRFNGDGTISTSYTNNSGTSFSYNTISDTRASFALPLTREQKLELCRTLLGMRHGKHSTK